MWDQPPSFDHEKLRVYQESVAFVAWVQNTLERLPARSAVTEQLDRAATSIPLNIAEGNGKYTPRDRCRYFDIARGSALECAGCLDVLVAKRQLDPAEVLPGKEMLRKTVAWLVGLIKSNSDRVHEPGLEYRLREED